jgi:DNA-directed RNA polymerase subunit E"
MVERVCRVCKMIVEGHECPNCGNKELADSYKGKVVVVNPEQSEISKNLKIIKKGAYAVRLG